MLRGLLALVTLFYFTGDAAAFFEKRTSLLLKCTTGGFNEIYCMGYIAAVFDSMTVAGHTVYGLRACPTGRVTVGELKEKVVKWIRDTMPPGSTVDDEGYRVEGIQFPGAAVVAAAIAKSYPCR
jgi:hypothetical protein